ncbi:unnamed protein product [Periconia digitata]|uniref:Mediator of RNA polymerase II transcription subunit 17 n=1 Tax=Periconia digitata TaxID=1303443 RepID=A0A9W4XQT4_9PLEO|nr:unnamed protein product [Periconia digitata]
MATTDDTTEIKLRAWPAPQKEPLDHKDILAQVTQLAAERGHLRGITEQSLQDEIEASKNDIGVVMDDSEEKSKLDEPSVKEKLEEIHASRMSMFKNLELAAFHAGNAMNLVNLALSRDPTKNLESAYTPMFKEVNIPRGSVGVDKGITLEESGRPEDIALHEDLKKRQNVVAKGSKMEALDWSTNSLLKAATELETEVRKETKYWEEVLSISGKGWSLQRTRGEKGNAPYAVHYGVPEANSRFKARSLAPLRMNKDGGIILDPNLKLKPKTLRVRIMDKERIIGTSHLPTQGLDEIDIEQSIQLSRDSLFEEELFYEMSMESRQLLGYGVELRDSVIHIATPGSNDQASQRKILVDCIDRDGQSALEVDQSQDWLAHSIAEALRLLLAHEHRMRSHRRSQIPPPMIDRGRQQSSPRLIRTLLAMFSHLKTVDSMHAYLHMTVKTVKSAGLDITLKASRESLWVKLAETVKDSENTDIPATDQVLQAFIRAFDATASIVLPCSGAQPESIVLDTRTYIGQPVFGSEHKLTLPPSLAKVLDLEPDQPRQFKFSSTEDAASYLDWILALYIAHDYLANGFSGRSSIRSEDPRLIIMSKGSSKGRVREDEIAIELDNGSLNASATLKNQTNEGATTESCTWNGAQTGPSLRDTVKGWIG